MNQSILLMPSTHRDRCPWACRLASVLIASAAGCIPTNVSFNAESLEISPDDHARWTDRVDWSDWGAYLSAAVAGYEIDAAAAAEKQARLERFLVMLAEIGPTRTPRLFTSREAKLAYCINAYNASIQFVNLELTRNGPPGALRAAQRENLYAFNIDGARRTPADLRREALKLAGDDWRVELALSDGRAIGPPLWRRPYLGDMLDGQLDDAVRRAIASPRVVAMSHVEVKRLKLGWGLYEIRDQMVADYEARTGAKGAAVLNALLYWADPLRRAELQGAVGYPIGLMRDDASFDFRQQQVAGAGGPAR